MKHFSTPARSMLLALTVTAVLTACGTRHISRDISDDGRAGEVIFPAVEHIVLKDGTFPNLDNLRAIGPGITKDQLYALLGTPHFREGYSGVREWDYLFNFRKDGSVIRCQYKVIFDKDYRGQSFHWAPEACAEVLGEPLPVNAVPHAAVSIAPASLPADALFAFGRSGLADLLPGGLVELSRLARQVESSGSVKGLRIVGHTDHLGNEADNQALSLQRAGTVQKFLQEQGIDAVIQVEGRGEREPLAMCQEQPRADLLACLAPNRRVEVFIDN